MKSLLARLFRSRPLRWSLIAVLLFGLFGYLALPLIAKSLLTSQLSAKLHRETTIREIVVHPYALSAYVRGFVVKERDGSATALSFDELYVNLEAASLLRGNLALKEIRLDQPYLKLVRNPDRSYNVTDLIEEFLNQPDEEPKTRFALNNIQLNGGKIDFDDKPMGKIHQVSDIYLAIPFVSNLPSYTDIYVQPSFKAHVNGRDVALSGKTRPFADKVEATLELDVDDLDLPKYLDYLPQKLPLRLSSGLLDSKLVATFSKPHGQQPTLQLAGDLALKQAEIADARGTPAFSLAGLKLHIGSSSLLGDPLSAQGNIELAKLAVKSYAPLAALEIDSGSLNAATRFDFALDQGKIRLVLDQLGADLSDLDLRLATEKQPFFRLAAASVKDARLDLAQRTLEIGEFASQSGKLQLRREHNGSLNLAQLAGAPAPKAAAKGDTPWNVTLKKLAVSDYGVRFEDKTPAQAVILNGDPISLTAENLSTAKGSKATLNLHGDLGKNAAIGAEGTLTLAPLQASLKLDVKGIDLVALQPYFTEKLNVSVSRGAVSTRGDLDLALPANAPAKVSYRGSANLAGFHVIDKANAADLLKWKSLYVGGIQTSTAPFKLAIAEVALSDFYSRLIINADGKLNLQQLVRAAPEQAAPPPASDSAPANIKIGKLTLQGGNVNFSDHFVKPNYSANLTDIGGRVAGLSSEPGSTADVDLRGRLDSAAPLEIGGQINPLGKDLFVDLKANVKGVELSPFTPYSGKYAGYAIEKGQLSLDVRYHIENRKLEAENHLFLDQLTFGESIESPDATKLPVQLALALLKNRKGEIDLHLPIGGSLDDPEFSMGGLVIKVIVNLLTKAITAPFALIGSMFGGGEELSYLEFAPGQQRIDTASESKLKNLAQALADRPALKLEIAGRIDPASDKEGLKQAMLEQKVKAQKLGDLIKQGVSAGSTDDLTLSAAEYPALLKRAYQQEKFPKPRNVLWLTKDLPVAEMEKLILTHTAISDDDLRDLANRRALAVKNWLLKNGQIASERVFLVAPKLAAEEVKDKGKVSRVDFSLK